MPSGSIIAKGIILIIIFTIIILFQLYLPSLVNIIIRAIYEDEVDEEENNKFINLSPSQIADIYTFIYYSLLLVLILLLCMLVLLFRNEYDEDTFVKTVLNYFYFDKNNYFSSIIVEYITICFVFLIPFFAIQIYRYIDNTMLVNSNNNISSIASTHYGYNPNLYSSHLKKGSFLTEKVKSMLDYLNLMYMCIPLVAILLIAFKYLFKTNLLLNNSKNYSLIFIIGVVIYIVVAIKSTIILAS